MAATYRKDLEGHLVGQGSPRGLADLTEPELISYVWWYFTREADEAERAKFEARLWRPEAGTAQREPPPPESPWSAEREMDSFRALRREAGA